MRLAGREPRRFYDGSKSCQSALQKLRCAVQFRKHPIHLGGCRSYEPLSLTPALSRWEREIIPRSPPMICLGTRDGSCRPPGPIHSLFPLPAGDGLGENSPNESSRFEPLNQGTPPLPASGHPLLHSEWRRGTGRGGVLV